LGIKTSNSTILQLPHPSINSNWGPHLTPNAYHNQKMVLEKMEEKKEKRKKKKDEQGNP